MPVIHANAGDGLPPTTLLGKERPVIVMVPGFTYAHRPRHRMPAPRSFALDAARDGFKVVNWPRGLGFEGRRRDEGLAIGFGWDARGSL